jgi:hypothetical protein
VLLTPPAVMASVSPPIPPLPFQRIPPLNNPPYQSHSLTSIANQAVAYATHSVAVGVASRKATISSILKN